MVDTIGNYEVLRMLGCGGMGEVYEARQQRTGKRVALKLLKPHLAARADIVARFKREAEAAAAIEHPSIVKVHEIAETHEGVLYIVMEYLEGQSLSDLLAARGPLDASLAVYIVYHVLAGLEVAHAMGIVHRDIKPDNIFLVENGTSRPVVKLLDFGLSKFDDPTRSDATLTGKGEMIGTPLYMSPEQAMGYKHPDCRMDLYAVGVVLYRCLTGKTPFHSRNMLTLVYRILTATPQAPRALRPELPKGLEDAITRAMARDPDDRYPTAREMIADLQPFVGGSTVVFERSIKPDLVPHTRSSALDNLASSDWLPDFLELLSKTTGNLVARSSCV